MQMKPDLVYSVLCDDVRQEINGKFIFLGVFQNIWVKGLPAVHHRLCIANSWYNGIGGFHARSAVVAPDKKTRVVERPGQDRPHGGGTRFDRGEDFFQNIRFAEEGLYWVEVSLEGDARDPLPVPGCAPSAQRPPAGP